MSNTPTPLGPASSSSTAEVLDAIGALQASVTDVQAQLAASLAVLQKAVFSAIDSLTIAKAQLDTSANNVQMILTSQAAPAQASLVKALADLSQLGKVLR